MAGASRQQRQVHTLAAVFGVLAVLGVVKVLVRSAARPDTVVEEFGMTKLLPGVSNASDVKRLEISVRGVKTRREDETDRVMLARKGEGWVIASAHDAPAVGSKIEGLIEQIVGLSGELRSEGTSVLDDYQLAAEDALHVVLQGSGAKELGHILAGKSAGRKQAFVRRNGEDRVFAVDLDFRSQAGLRGKPGEKKPLSRKRWLDTLVLKLASDDVRTISLTWPERRLVLEKAEAEGGAGASPDGAAGAAGDEAAAAADPPTPEWTVTENGLALPYKKSATDALLRVLCNLRVDDVLDPAAKDGLELGDDAPYRCVVSLADGSQHTVLGAPAPTGGDMAVWVSSRDGQLSRISKARLARLFKPAKELYELPPPGIDGDTLQAITLVDRGARRVFTKRDGAWAMDTPQCSREAQPKALEAMVKAWVGLTPEDVVGAGSDEDRGLTEPEYEAELAMGGDQVRRLVVGGTVAWSDGRYARLGGDDGPTLVLPGRTFRQLFPRLAGVLDTRLWPGLERDKVVGVAVATSGDAGFSVRREGEQWQLTVDGTDHQASKEEVERWIGRLASMRATDVVDGPIEEETAGTIRFETEDGGAHSVSVGPHKKDRVTLWLEDGGVTFTVASRRVKEVLPEAASLAVGPLGADEGDKAPAKATDGPVDPAVPEPPPPPPPPKP